MFKPGQTVLISNYRNDGMYRLMRIIKVRNTHKGDQLLSGGTYARRVMLRSKYLITGTDLDRGVTHSYYTEMGDVTVTNWFSRRLHYLLVALGKREQAE